MSKPPKLNTWPARADLSDRELAKIIGGVLGGLAGMTDLVTLRRAVTWWAESDDAWKAFGLVPEVWETVKHKIQGDLP